MAAACPLSNAARTSQRTATRASAPTSWDSCGRRDGCAGLPGVDEAQTKEERPGQCTKHMTKVSRLI